MAAHNLYRARHERYAFICSLGAVRGGAVEGNVHVCWTTTNIRVVAMTG